LDLYEAEEELKIYKATVALAYPIHNFEIFIDTNTLSQFDNWFRAINLAICYPSTTADFFWESNATLNQ